MIQKITPHRKTDTGPIEMKDLYFLSSIFFESIAIQIDVPITIKNVMVFPVFKSASAQATDARIPIETNMHINVFIFIYGLIHALLGLFPLLTTTPVFSKIGTM